MSFTDQNGRVNKQRYRILTNFALPEAVAVRIAEAGDSQEQQALASSTTLAVDAAVIIGETSRNYHALQSVLYNVAVPEVLNAVLSQRRETRKTVLRTILTKWNMDEAAQQQFVNRRLPADIADEYLQNRCWFPEPAVKALLRASAPIAVEYLAELAATDLDDDILAETAETVIKSTAKLDRGSRQTTAARWLAEACWLRPVIKTVALNSDAAVATAALARIGLTDDETATVVTKLADINCLWLTRHTVEQLLTNPTVATETRLQIAEQYPDAAAGAAAAGAHRPAKTITDGRQLRNVAELDVLDKAVAGTSTFTHLADLIEHPATTRDPHILHRLVKLSTTQHETAGPLRRKLLTHIIQLQNDNELAATFTKTTHERRRMQREAIGSNAMFAERIAAQKGTHTRHKQTSHGTGKTRQNRWRDENETTGTVSRQPVGEVQHWQLRLLGQYWQDQLGDGANDKSAAAWQTALEMVSTVPEQSSADIIKLVKTLGVSN